MGILAEVFAALPAQAGTYEATRASGAPGRFDATEFNGATPLEFGQLWALLESTPWHADRFQLENVTPSSEDDSWLYRFPEPFAQALAAIPEPELPALAQAWGELEEFEEIAPDTLARGLAQLRRQALSAAASGLDLYLWGSL